MIRYAVARVGLFLACAVLAMALLPKELNLLLKLMLALVASAALALAFLRRLRGEVAEQMSLRARRRAEQRDRLRAALAGEDPAP
jgi:uncharacterized protein DUF4229